jgi:hypothetical protein
LDILRTRGSEYEQDGKGREFLIRLIELEVEKMMRILKAKEF